MDIKSLILIVAVGLVSACSSGGGDDDGDDGGSTATTGTSPSVVTVSGLMKTLVGTYTSACYDIGAGSSRQDIHDYGASDDNTLIVTANVYDAVTDCSANRVQSTIVAAVTAAGTVMIQGWEMGDNGGTFPPTAADASGLLGLNESVTVLNLAITTVSGTQFDGIAAGDAVNLFYVVDDTGTGIVLYSDQNNDTGMETASTQDPLFGF